MKIKRSITEGLRTWIEIDAQAAKKNYLIFRKLIGKNVKLWAVVKSNAYGHGIFAFSKLMERFGIDGLCVDSIVEGIALRRSGVKKPILVLGSTLPSRYSEAAKNNITISISNFDALKALIREKNIPQFHLKIDTGMHRQGFYVEDIPRVIRFLKINKPYIKNKLMGVFTHFSSAKDLNYPGYSDLQFKNFQEVIILLESAGFTKLIKHAAATGGTLINKKYHLDAVRIGIGMYGLWPSKELEVQLDNIKLHPVLSWRAIVTEVKPLKAGDYVGYDLTERVPKAIRMAILPIGYWHGLSRSLSSMGEVIINGSRARILGRVSMDITAVGLRDNAKSGDIATLIGRSIIRATNRACTYNGDEIFAWEIAQKAGTSHYEFLTRLNPLMERVIIE